MVEIPEGMAAWHGGPKPSDWSGEAVQFRSGKVMQAPAGAIWKLGWDHSYGEGDIIAYTPTPTDTADHREAVDPAFGQVQWHSSEEDGGPDVGILIGLGEKKALWIGELLNSDGADVGFIFYGIGERVAAPMNDWQLVRDLFEDHVSPALRASLIAGPPEGWQTVDNAPHACHVLATHFDWDIGEWVYGVVMSPPTKPFTHWQMLPPMPAMIAAATGEA